MPWPRTSDSAGRDLILPGEPITTEIKDVEFSAVAFETMFIILEPLIEPHYSVVVGIKKG